MRHRPMVIIQSIKHYVHRSNTAIAGGNLSGLAVASAVVAPATGNANEVAEGSIIKAVYIELWILSDAVTGDESQFTVVLEKRPSNAPGMTFAQSSNLGAYPNKKNILFTSQAIVGASIDGNGAVPVMRGWYLIPKGKQRMGIGDDIALSIAAVGDLSMCGIFTFKEYK